jgi:hypothetical protein
MKLKFLIPILTICILAVSCTNQDEMLTVIKPDGTCYREFTHTVDSLFMNGHTAKNNPFPVDLDSGWKISWAYLTPEIHTNWPVKNWKWNAGDTTKKISVTARRNYSDAKEMGEKFRFKKSDEWHKFRTTSSLEKKFRWFYTYYNYKEVYPKIKTFDAVPFSKYMTNDEASFWFSGQPDLLKGMNGVEIREYIGDLENKYNSWFGHNLWNVEFKTLLANYDLLDPKPVSKNRLEQARDSAFKKNMTFNKNGEMELEMDKCLDNYFKTTAFSALWNKKASPMKKFEDDLDSLDFINYFTKSVDYKLMLPGKVTEQGNAAFRGDTLVWRLTAYRMVFSDYEISAQSRKANVWAFILSGLIAVFAIGSYFYTFKK